MMSFVSDSPILSLSDLVRSRNSLNDNGPSYGSVEKFFDFIEEDQPKIANNLSGPKADFVMPERPNYYQWVSKTVDVRQLMRKYGMQAGFHLPFSTAENKSLLQKLETQQIKILRLRGAIEESSAAIKELKGHATQSAIDIRFQQSLIDSKCLQRDREAHNEVIANRIREKRMRQLARMKQDILDYNEKNRVRLLDLENRKDRMKGLQEKVLSDKRRLELWKEMSGKTEAFLKLIIGHKEHDERHAWELENKQTDLGALNKELRMELDGAAMNTTKLSEQYARLSIEYRKEHRERKEMVTMWAATLEAMKKKDMDVKEISKEYCDIRNKIRRVQLGIKEQEKVVIEQEWNIRKTELDQHILDRRVGDLRETLMREKELLLVLKNETTMNKVVIQQTTIAIQGLEAAFNRSTERVKHFKRKTMGVQDTIEILRKKVDDVSKGKSTVENDLSKMEEVLRQEEIQYNKNNREVERMRKFCWERNNDKTSIEEQIQRTETRASRFKSNIIILQIKEYDAMEALAKKQSQQYRLDLEISSIETRMVRIMNDSVNPEYFKLQQKCVALRDAELEAANEREFITKEVHMVKDFAYRYTKEIEVTSKKQENLRFMVDNINLEANRMEGLLDAYINEQKQLTIQLSLDKINLKRLNDSYRINRGKVLSIAQSRATMEWAVLERKSEIKFAVKMLMKQRKELRGHTARRKLAISNINNFCEKLKGRFELTTRLMAAGDGVTGEDAMTFQIHKIARERETLNAEQKKWETRLTEANIEAEGLTNVFLIMKTSNDAFRKNLAVASKTSVEAREVEQAMKNQKRSIVIRNRCIKVGAGLKINIDALQKQIDVTIQETEDLIGILELKEKEGSTKTIEHNRLRDRIHRWNNLLAKKTQQLRRKVSQEFLKHATKDLKHRIINLKFQKAMEQVEVAVAENPQLKDRLFEFLDEHNMMGDFERAKKNRVQGTTGPSRSNSTIKSSVYHSSRPTSGKSRQSAYQTDSLNASQSHGSRSSSQRSHPIFQISNRKSLQISKAEK